MSKSEGTGVGAGESVGVTVGWMERLGAFELLLVGVELGAGDGYGETVG